jgi:hypothetical protein
MLKKYLFWASLGPICLALTLVVSHAFLLSISVLLCWIVFLLTLREVEARDRKREIQLIQEATHLEEEIARYREELNVLRVDYYQLALFAEVPSPSPPQPELKGEPLYAQLRKQFAEKSEVLNATRKELFYTENRLLALQKERQLEALEPSPQELALVRQLKEAEEGFHALEAEVEHLQEIVAQLLKKKPTVSRSRKRDRLQSSFI